MAVVWDQYAAADEERRAREEQELNLNSYLEPLEEEMAALEPTDQELADIEDQLHELDMS